MSMPHLLSRAFRYGVYDWTRDMPRASRAVALSGMFLQGYAIWAGFSRSLIWPVMWPGTALVFLSAILIYVAGYSLLNAALASEFIRKTQLEGEQTAAAQIQRTLQPERVESPPGYDISTYYKPFRVVGGDYFDVIDLPADRTIVAIADVSGKGIPAALLAANIQALVRTLATTANSLTDVAQQINRHLCRHTPGNRFATAVLLMLDRASGQITYVNAGHNPPMLRTAGSISSLEPTGMALGWFSDAPYDEGHAAMAPGAALSRDGTLASVTALVDPRFNEDDVSVLLVTRAA